jgi:transposase
MEMAYKNLNLEECISALEQRDFAIAQLKSELAQLKRMIFGSKSERFLPGELPGQLSLDIDPAPQTPVPAPAVKVESHDRRKKEKEKKHPLRMPFPKDLPVETTILMPPGDLSDYKEIGEEITEELELIEAKLFVKRTVRKKYARKDGEGVIIGELPSRLIPKGLFGPGLLTQVLIDKYVDHLPLYRQLQRFERAGVKLAYSTLADVPRQICPWLEPLYDELSRQVINSSYLQADETPTPVLDKNKKQKTHTGYHWVYRSPEARLVLFDYRDSRGREGPDEILKTFKGFLQTDGYAVYDDFENKKDITLVGCMAHARRYFEQALDNDRQRAEYVLGQIQKLYTIERTIREEQKTPEEIFSLRQEKSLPVLEELKKWLDDNLMQVLPKSPMGKAMAYTLARWEKLLVYTLHPQLEIDNNLVENAIRPTVVGRKNYLFSGSHQGARRSAMIYSFFASCKVNNINPQLWLADVLGRIADTKTSRLHALLPNQWMPQGRQ